MIKCFNLTTKITQHLLHTTALLLGGIPLMYVTSNRMTKNWLTEGKINFTSVFKWESEFLVYTFPWQAAVEEKL